MKRSSTEELDAIHRETVGESLSQLPDNKSEQPSQNDGMSTAFDDDEELYEDNNNVFKDGSEEVPDYMNVPVEPDYEETEDRTKSVPPTPSKTVNNPQAILRQPPRPVPRARNPASVKSEVSITNNNGQMMDSKNQQSSNHVTQQQAPPQASNPLMPKPPQRSPETSLSIAGDSLTEGPKWGSQTCHSEAVPQSNIHTSGSNTFDEEYDTPPPMPPKQLHTRRSADMSTGDAKEAVEAYFENDKSGKLEDALPKKMKLPTIPHSATESFQPPAASSSSSSPRNDLPHHNQNTREPQVASRKPPPPVAKRTNKPMLPTPTKSNSRSQNKPDATSTEPALTNVRNLKHQISQKLREERQRKEQNNNEQQSEPPSQVSVSGQPVATPRSHPPTKPLPEPKHRGSPIPGGIPIFGGVPIAGGVSIFPAMPSNIPTQRLPTARPSPQVPPQQLDSAPNSPLRQLPPVRTPISPQGPPKLPPTAVPTRPSRPAPGPPPSSLPPPQPPPKSTAALSGFSSEEE